MSKKSRSEIVRELRGYPEYARPSSSRGFNTEELRRCLEDCRDIFEVREVKKD